MVDAWRLRRLPAPANSSRAPFAAQAAGAAFVTLLACMGDPQLPNVLADPASLGLAAASSVQHQPIAPSVRMGALPSDRQLLEALAANGYRAGGEPPAAAGQRELAAQGEPTTLRLHTLKLILHTVAAVCRHCTKVRMHPSRRRQHLPAHSGHRLTARSCRPALVQHQGGGVATAALSREGLCDLVVAVARMGLDPDGGLLSAELVTGAAAHCATPWHPIGAGT